MSLSSGISEGNRRKIADRIMACYKELETSVEQSAILNERISTLREEITTLNMELKAMDKALNSYIDANVNYDLLPKRSFR
jgi:uncharacterized small protein (DUF1192 family)